MEVGGWVEAGPGVPESGHAGEHVESFPLKFAFDAFSGDCAPGRVCLCVFDEPGFVVGAFSFSRGGGFYRSSVRIFVLAIEVEGAAIDSS